MENKQLFTALNNLQRNIYESFRNFSTTTDNLDSPRIISFFEEQGARRKNFYNEIREVIKVLGELPKDITRPFGDAADEVFMDLKTAFSSEDDKIVLQETKVVEEKLIKGYQEVLAKAELPTAIETVCSRQLEEVIKDHQKVSAMLVQVS